INAQLTQTLVSKKPGAYFSAMSNPHSPDFRPASTFGPLSPLPVILQNLWGKAFFICLFSRKKTGGYFTNTFCKKFTIHLIESAPNLRERNSGTVLVARFLRFQFLAQSRPLFFPALRVPAISDR